MDDVAECFQKAVADHEMTIVSEAGFARQITFKTPKTYNNHFHITTWPGYLAISGDAGCYVFARLPDMFEFFRGDRINPQYWSEKLRAADRNSGYQTFSEEKFQACLKNDFEQWSFDSDDEKAKAWEAIEESELSPDRMPSTMDEAIHAALDYECRITKNRFNDFWDHNFQDYTFRFLWCCYAIQWAIRKYDEIQAPAVREVAAVPA